MNKKPSRMAEMCAAIVSVSLAVAVALLVLALGGGLAYRLFILAAGLQ